MDDDFDADAIRRAGVIAEIELAILASTCPAKARTVLLGVMGITSLKQITHAGPALGWIAAFDSLCRPDTGALMADEVIPYQAKFIADIEIRRVRMADPARARSVLLGILGLASLFDATPAQLLLARESLEILEVQEHERGWRRDRNAG